MDILTNILQEAGLEKRLLDLRRLDDAVALQFPCDRSIGVHIAVQGPLWIHSERRVEPVQLETGDMAFMARGHGHVLSRNASPTALPTKSVLERAGEALGLGAVSGSRVISGAYQLWHTPLHPLFGQLPDWFILRADEVPPLSPLGLTVGLMREELSSPQLGSERALHGLLDVVFTYLLRTMLTRMEHNARFAHAMHDAAIQQAVALMHDDCAHPWTLDELASSVGLSRTLFAERFRSATGDTPLQYLRAVRMQRAIRLLDARTITLEQVANAVGYQDAFSFSKVFKRTVGLSPRDFRRLNSQDAESPHRFRAS